MAQSRLCSIPGCGKPVFGHGWCSAHYSRWRRKGTPLGRDTKIERKCSVPECEDLARVRGWCGKHYQRWNKHKDPSETNGTERGAPLRFLTEIVMNHGGDECLRWPFSTDQNGYGRVRYNGETRRVNGIVCELSHGPAPSPKHEVAHSCGNGAMGCCAPRHLAWKTHTENEADKLMHGTLRVGERHARAKLSNDQVRKIRSLAGTMLQREIAGIFGISQSQISEVVNRRTYASIY